MTDKAKLNKVKKATKPKDTEKILVIQAEKIATLEAQILYGQAETENNRKRALEEAEKTRKYAIEGFSQEILLVKDSLDAALAIKNATLESYKDGVELEDDIPF